MFIYDGKSYDTIKMDEYNLISLSRNKSLSCNDDGVIYELKLSGPKELEKVTLTNDLSIEGLDRMYKELDMYETLIHELYKMVKDRD